MKQEGIKFFSYFILILGILTVVLFVGILRQKVEEDYSKAEFIADMEAGNVTNVEIQLNSETPTGALYINLKNGDDKTLYVSDIVEMEEIVRSYGFDPMVHDVRRDSWFLTTLVPMLVVIVVGLFLFMMINAQNAGAGAGNAKMMNFGRSRAKMSMGDKAVTF